MSKVLDIGERCVWCGDHTSFGSGKFVNRIPVYTDMENTPYNDDPILAPAYTHVEGYGCEECYEYENEEIEL